MDFWLGRGREGFLAQELKISNLDKVSWTFTRVVDFIIYSVYKKKKSLLDIGTEVVR